MASITAHAIINAPACFKYELLVFLIKNPPNPQHIGVAIEMMGISEKRRPGPKE